MPVFFTAVGTALTHFAEGALMGVSVYLASRGKALVTDKE